MQMVSAIALLLGGFLFGWLFPELPVPDRWRGPLAALLIGLGIGLALVVLRLRTRASGDLSKLLTSGAAY